MSIEILSGDKGAVLTDTTDGMAFGPIFEDREEAGAFLRWYESVAWNNARKGSVRIADLRRLDGAAQKGVADLWRAFLADHPEAECPFDGEDSVGFLTDRDRSDGSGAWTPFCQCECHLRARFVAGDPSVTMVKGEQR